MTTKTLSVSDLKLYDLGSINLVAGRMDAQNPLLAKKLHELGYIYALYGALDGLSLSYSMFKYSFDVLITDQNLSSSDIMHDWMLTPSGILTTAASSITLITFSFLANVFDDDDKNRFKRFVAIAWPYCRDTMKGLKNGYKGVKSTIQAMEFLGGQDLNNLIVPFGLLLGGLSVINRLWARYWTAQRKDMMKANAKLLAEMQDTLTLDSLDENFKKINSQSLRLRSMMLLSAAYGGVVDGLYLYVGVLGLCSMLPPVFVAMTVFCALYFLACVATRVYEEYDFQRKLVISQAKIELAYHGKKIELLFAELQELPAKLSADPENKSLLLLQDELISDFESTVMMFQQKRKELCSLSTLSYTSAFLSGLKDGLAAYGALSSIMFAVATVLILASASFPPALLITCVSLGMACLIGFIAFSMIQTYRHRAKQEQDPDLPNTELLKIGQLFKEAKNEVECLEPEHVKTTIVDGMAVDPSPQFYFQEASEIARSLCSGVGKGSKAIDFTMNALQEVNEKGHYQDTPIMFGFIGLSAIVYALVLGLRAYARGFGKPPIDAPPTDKSKDSEEIEMEVFPPASINEKWLSSDKESGSGQEQQPPDSPPLRAPTRSGHSIFNTPTQTRSSPNTNLDDLSSSNFQRSHSSINLSSIEVPPTQPPHVQMSDKSLGLM